MEYDKQNIQTAVSLINYRRCETLKIELTTDSVTKMSVLH